MTRTSLDDALWASLMLTMQQIPRAWKRDEAALRGVGALGWFRDSRTLFLLWFEHPDATQVQC